MVEAYRIWHSFGSALWTLRPHPGRRFARPYGQFLLGRPAFGSTPQRFATRAAFTAPSAADATNTTGSHTRSLVTKLSKTWLMPHHPGIMAAFCAQAAHTSVAAGKLGEAEPNLSTASSDSAAVAGSPDAPDSRHTAEVTSQPSTHVSGSTGQSNASASDIPDAAAAAHPGACRGGYDGAGASDVATACGSGAPFNPAAGILDMVSHHARSDPPVAPSPATTASDSHADSAAASITTDTHAAPTSFQGSTVSTAQRAGGGDTRSAGSVASMASQGGGAATSAFSGNPAAASPPVLQVLSVEAAHPSFNAIGSSSSSVEAARQSSPGLAPAASGVSSVSSSSSSTPAPRSAVTSRPVDLDMVLSPSQRLVLQHVPTMRLGELVAHIASDNNHATPLYWWPLADALHACDFSPFRSATFSDLCNFASLARSAECIDGRLWQTLVEAADAAAPRDGGSTRDLVILLNAYASALSASSTPVWLRRRVHLLLVSTPPPPPDALLPLFETSFITEASREFTLHTVYNLKQRLHRADQLAQKLAPLLGSTAVPPALAAQLLAASVARFPLVFHVWQQLTAHLNDERLFGVVGSAAATFAEAVKAVTESSLLSSSKTTTTTTAAAAAAAARSTHTVDATATTFAARSLSPNVPAVAMYHQWVLLLSLMSVRPANSSVALQTLERVQHTLSGCSVATLTRLVRYTGQLATRPATPVPCTKSNCNLSPSSDAGAPAGRGSSSSSSGAHSTAAPSLRLARQDGGRSTITSRDPASTRVADVTASTSANAAGWCSDGGRHASLDTAAVADDSGGAFRTLLANSPQMVTALQEVCSNLFTGAVRQKGLDIGAIMDLANAWSLVPVPPAASRLLCNSIAYLITRITQDSMIGRTAGSIPPMSPFTLEQLLPLVRAHTRPSFAAGADILKSNDSNSGKAPAKPPGKGPWLVQGGRNPESSLLSALALALPAAACAPTAHSIAPRPKVSTPLLSLIEACRRLTQGGASDKALVRLWLNSFAALDVEHTSSVEEVKALQQLALRATYGDSAAADAQMAGISMGTKMGGTSGTAERTLGGRGADSERLRESGARGESRSAEGERLPVIATGRGAKKGGAGRVDAVVGADGGGGRVEQEISITESLSLAQRRELSQWRAVMTLSDVEQVLTVNAATNAMPENEAIRRVTHATRWLLRDGRYTTWSAVQLVDMMVKASLMDKSRSDRPFLAQAVKAAGRDAATCPVPQLLQLLHTVASIQGWHWGQNVSLALAAKEIFNAFTQRVDAMTLHQLNDAKRVLQAAHKDWVGKQAWVAAHAAVVAAEKRHGGPLPHGFKQEHLREVVDSVQVLQQQQGQQQAEVSLAALRTRASVLAKQQLDNKAKMQLLSRRADTATEGVATDADQRLLVQLGGVAASTGSGTSAGSESAVGPKRRLFNSTPEEQQTDTSSSTSHNDPLLARRAVTSSTAAADPPTIAPHDASLSGGKKVVSSSTATADSSSTARHDKHLSGPKEVTGSTASVDPPSVAETSGQNFIDRGGRGSGSSGSEAGGSGSGGGRGRATPPLHTAQRPLNDGDAGGDGLIRWEGDAVAWPITPVGTDESHAHAVRSMRGGGGGGAAAAAADLRDAIPGSVAVMDAVRYVDRLSEHTARFQLKHLAKSAQLQGRRLDYVLPSSKANAGVNRRQLVQIVIAMFKRGATYNEIRPVLAEVYEALPTQNTESIVQLLVLLSRKRRPGEHDEGLWAHAGDVLARNLGSSRQVHRAGTMLTSFAAAGLKHAGLQAAVEQMLLDEGKTAQASMSEKRAKLDKKQRSPRDLLRIMWELQILGGAQSEALKDSVIKSCQQWFTACLSGKLFTNRPPTTEDASAMQRLCVAWGRHEAAAALDEAVQKLPSRSNKKRAAVLRSLVTAYEEGEPLNRCKNMPNRRRDEKEARMRQHAAVAKSLYTSPKPMGYGRRQKKKASSRGRAGDRGRPGSSYPPSPAKAPHFQGSRVARMKQPPAAG